MIVRDVKAVDENLNYTVILQALADLYRQK